MTKAQVAQKLSTLEKERTQTLANLNAIEGAVHILEQLLQEWDRPSEGATFPAAVPDMKVG